MAPSTVHLPNGMTLTVTPVFGGLYFKANDLTTQNSAFPPGWTIILNSEDEESDHVPPSTAAHTLQANQSTLKREEKDKGHHVHRFRKPSLHNDHMFISSISNPSSNDFRPATSPTRQIAMMLWASLWWYFHQPEPAPQLLTSASASTPEAGRPKGDWVVNINREGIFKGKHLLPKLERMGLITTLDSTVGLDPDDGVSARGSGEGFTQMFVSRKSFWQLDPRIYLFSLSPTQAHSPYPSVSPASSRPASPVRGMTPRNADDPSVASLGASAATPMLNRHVTPPGPFHSTSHLPTFYPPAPLQYTTTNGIRHPVRPKPPRQGETFYTRYIPSLGQYLSFRVASLSRNPFVPRGPGTSNTANHRDSLHSLNMGGHSHAGSENSIPTIQNLSLADVANNAAKEREAGTLGQNTSDTSRMNDTELLHKWMNDPRVAHSWAEDGPLSHQTDFLSHNLTDKHAFPVIGCFDGKPFGYFELYWVKEDKVAAHTDVGSWDRGIHCLVGEQEFRGQHRVKVWLSALVHYCWLADMRTETVVMEPRVDNEKYVISLHSAYAVV